MDRKSLNGISLAHVDRGEGMPIVLIHGFPLDHTMWSTQIDALSNDYRVIAPDLRGFGRSDVTEGTVTMEQMADDVAGLLDALEITEPIVLGGLSMGGYVAFAFYRKYADRMGGLILCDTRAAEDSPEKKAARLEMAQGVLSEGAAPVAEAMTASLFSQSTRQDHPEVIDSMCQVMLASDPQGIAAASRGMAQREDAQSMLPQITCPTLVIVGAEDSISPPEEMVVICRAIPHGRYVEIPQAGHMSPVENPEEFNSAILEFLNTM